ncbi:MAG: hypothetical protein OER04_03780 [Cyclobacteriaceae bacterium]|nr:hypothetical protein [Cyclobacteriaceae bacterium]
MKYLLVICLFIMHMESMAQKDSSITIPFISANIQIVPLNAEGFLIVDYSGPQINQDQLALAIMHYDMDLQQRWKNVLPVTRGLQLQHYQVLEGFLFIAFSDGKRKYLEMYRVDLHQGHFQKSQYLFSNSFSLDHIAASGAKLWVSGIMSNQGVLFYLDESKNQAHILPTAYSAKVNAIRELEYHKESGKLSFLLLTEIGKQQSFVLRSLQSSKNQVVENLELVPPPGLQLTQARYRTYEDHQYILGTSFKKDPEQAIGIFLYKIKDGEVVAKHFQLFKETPQYSDFTFWRGPENAPEQRSKKAGNHVLIDEVLFYQSSIVISLDILEKQYQAKGALHQEMERNQLVTNLDQDQYGRRALDQSGDENQTAEDRINRRSATDILQYRYRNALVAQPTFQGLGLERNITFTFDRQLKFQNCRGVKTSKPELTYLGEPNSFAAPSGIRQLYDQGDAYYTWIYLPKEGTTEGFRLIEHSSSNSKMIRLSATEVMTAQMDQQPAGYLLHLKKAPLVPQATDQQ